MKANIAIGVAAVALVLVLGRVADAAEEPLRDARPGPEAAPQPWLYLDDPTTPRAMTVTAHTRATYTNASSSLSKPSAFDLARRGGVLEAGADVGVLPWLALTAAGSGASDGGTVGAIGGVRVALLPAEWSTHLVLGGGAMRDLSG